ncbi:MAG TPA: TraR/DksA family transcriptional regulator [Gemmataceae bacterium]|nr:TraR/DksA family transcriptional regulator [Gemmataceae bacterium]
MFTKAEKSVYRQSLLDLTTRLEGERSQLKGEALQPTGGEASGGLSDFPVHPADLSSRGVEEEVTLGLLENEEQLIEELNAALARLDEGGYGRCERCRQEITRARLQAVPYARCCMSCARQLLEEIVL